MLDLVLLDGTLVMEDSLCPGRCLGVFKGKIKLIEPGQPFETREVIDSKGLYIAPGFIDLHVHGGGGADFLDASGDALERITRFHSRHGTTGLLATVAASPPEQMARALERAAGRIGLGQGAVILGAHLEGPFVNPSFNGALNRACLRKPDLVVAEELLAAGRGGVKAVTLAPELPGSRELIEMLSSRGVIPALGHSGATFTETVSAAESGLRHITHIFNAMAGIHHREPGPAGAALSSEKISAEVIADGRHVHPFILKLLWQSMGDRLALVSDAISAAGLPDGRYSFAGQEIAVAGGRAELPCGRLAGSTLTLLEAVKNMVGKVGLSLPQAVRLASGNPARFLGLPGKGQLKDGFDADLVLLDIDLDPALVIVGGSIVYRRDPEH